VKVVRLVWFKTPYRVSWEGLPNFW